VFSFLRQLSQLLPTFTAERRTAASLLLSATQQSIDISCPPGTQQQTLTSNLRRVSDGTDGQTDKSTDGRPTVT